MVKDKEAVVVGAAVVAWAAVAAAWAAAVVNPAVSGPGLVDSASVRPAASGCRIRPGSRALKSSVRNVARR